MTSLSVMGVGKIGGEVAYLASVLGIADEICLYDIDTALSRAQMLDILHTGIDLSISTDPEDISGADIAVFSAGMGRTPDVRTRADLLMVNLPAVNECAAFLEDYSGVLITITNPMDANNYYFHHHCGIPRERCIGFGGQLDTARFGGYLTEYGILGDAWVLGEHGEHQVPLFSCLSEDVPEGTRNEILGKMRRSSMEVIRGKGGTVFGPAWHIANLVRIVAEDAHAVVPVSCILNGEYGVSGCSLGIPARIGRRGIEEIIEWKLDEWEQAHFMEAAAASCALCRRADE
ncbi:malate dehydrogenase [Methanogenium organophilum]|uniref:malate dehydrogenase n=1 Tax=Methanogenium organophilum TaxID=2199 RepID=A0A9X9S2L5_METOG|nr:lactate dehydrogenase [Methanogenium organophilum]WAI00647.1 lactate dehydrogenase [Methanogenium organophilum]